MSFIARTRRCMMPPPCPPFSYSKARFLSELFVKKLSFYTTENDLKNMFSPFGVVRDARLIVDPKTRRHKGFGFVTFETEIEAQKAVKALDARHHGLYNMHHLLLDKFPKNADSAQAILHVLQF